MNPTICIFFFFISSNSLSQELSEDPEKSPLFKNIRLPVINIGIKKTPRKTISVPIFTKTKTVPNTVVYRSYEPTYSKTYPINPIKTKTYPTHSHPSFTESYPTIFTYPLNPATTSYPRTNTNTNVYNVIPTVTKTVTVSPSGDQPVLNTLIADERFSTLVAAVTAANITQDTIDSIAPVTIFAPTNAAFAKIDNETLTTLLADQVALTATLLRHVVPGKAVRIPEGTTVLDHAADGTITVTRSLDDIYSESVTARTNQGSATIKEFDIKASDGVIFAIDSVI